ncbi:MAG: DUF58 domain-containing protein [Micromonosporaceae bacterium]
MNEAPRAGRHALTWRLSPRARQLATVALIAIAAAIIAGRPAVMLLAAPAMAALAATVPGTRPRELEMAVTAPVARCFEGEDIELHVTVACAQRLDEIAMSLPVPAGCELAVGPAAQVTADAAQMRADWTLRAAWWGRHRPGPVQIRCRARGGMWQAELVCPIGQVEVYPRAERFRARLVPADLLRRIGEHAARAAGDGVEFAGIRSYTPGDRPRDVNWRVTARRGRLHVNERAAQRAADLVVAVDGFSAAGPPGDTTLDLAVHGAVALADGYLRIGDRVGVVLLGGIPHWLGPSAGHQHFYRIAEALLDARQDSAVTPDMGRIPRAALPPGALVVVFSPLLDKRALDIIADLRERRFPLVVVDVLRHEPQIRRRSSVGVLALRLWRLDRRALRLSLTELGVPVVTWDQPRGPHGDEPDVPDSLDAALAPLRRLPMLARRP